MVESNHVEKVAGKLKEHQQACPWEDIPEGVIPVRLQVLDFEPFCYNIKVADPGYDKDHSGNWGASYLGEGDSESRLESIAHDLLSQALEDKAQAV